MVKSAKQNIVSKDSTEAELIALFDMMQHVAKCNALMIAQGVKMLCQKDNTFTITLVKIRGGVWCGKCMRVRQESVQERLEMGDFVVE